MQERKSFKGKREKRGKSSDTEDIEGGREKKKDGRSVREREMSFKLPFW